MVRTRTAARISVRLTVCAALALSGLAAAAPAASAVTTTTLTVTTTADVTVTTGACGTATIVATPSPLSLREATCLANNIEASTGNTVVINLPGGTYHLINGELHPGLLANSTTVLAGAGSGVTTIDAGGLSRVMYTDHSFLGGVSVSISGVTLTGGNIGSGQGGAVIGGTAGDTLTIDSTVIIGNHSNTTTPSSAFGEGGGVAFFEGVLIIKNSVISNNSSNSSPGSGVSYRTNSAVASQRVTIDNTLFSGNTTTNTSGQVTGGALSLFAPSGAPKFTVTNSSFVNNTIAGPSGFNRGAAIAAMSGALTVTGSTFTGNSATGGAAQSGGAIQLTGTSATIHYNRFANNVATTGSAIYQISATADATENWWGCNGGPGAAGCDTVFGISAITPRLTLTGSASPSTVTKPNGASTVTVGLTTDSGGNPVDVSLLGVFAGLPIAWSNPLPAGAAVTPASSALSGAQASTAYDSGTLGSGLSSVSATLDGGLPLVVPITVNGAPTITSADHFTFPVGVPSTFTVTTTGFPAPVITRVGTLPAGVNFVNNGNGTATISGTAAAGTGGTYPVVLTATNSTAPVATQTFSVLVNRSPLFTSAAATTFVTGTPGTFTVTTSGPPTVTAITRTGVLPGGVTFLDNSDGTATLSGTPVAGSAGGYALTLTATNGILPNATQTLVLTVRSAPSVVIDPASQTVPPGTPVSFNASATGAPTPTLQWQVSVNGGATFTDIPGATSSPLSLTAQVALSGNQYRAVFTNVVTSVNSAAATLLVGTAPAVTSANTTTFAVGVAGTFTVAASGVPSPALTGTAFPAWLTLTDHGDGTATLAGTPPPGSAGTVPVTIAAANGFQPDATQAFTLVIDGSPAITSADHASFAVGQSGLFAITTTPGHPAATTLTEAGALPSGVSFAADSGGGGSLSGTPAPGTGGTYSITLTAQATGGSTTPTQQSFVLTVLEAPAITSADHVTFALGVNNNFTITTTGGFPTPAMITGSGALPTGINLTVIGDGTATLSGTATVSGSFLLNLVADNGSGQMTVQAFTLNIDASPTITSADHAAFTVGQDGLFAITTSPGHPAATTLTETGALPAGVSFAADISGGGSLSGTPAPGTGGSYPITLTAAAIGGSATPAQQSFVLTVVEAPAITSVDNATFVAGAPDSFTITTAGGFPTPSVLTVSGTLPAGIAFTDVGNGTGLLAGTGTVPGVYPLTLTADNGSGQQTAQQFTLTVQAPPTITSDPAVTFTAGVAGTFTVTTAAGVPAGTLLSQSGTMPAGVTFTDNGDGTATLAGTSDVTGAFPMTLSAGNGVAPDASQAFVLTLAAAAVLDLPPALPASDGALTGVPADTAVGQLLADVSGTGFAAGATITFGFYAPATVLGHATADSTGTFHASVTVPTSAGQFVIVAAGIGADGVARFLEAVTVVSAAPVSPTTTPPASASPSPPTSSGGPLASTGPIVDPDRAIGWALLTLLAGLGLLAGGRRRHRRH